MAKILTCDDNPVITDFITTLLKPHHEVLVASNGEEAIELARSENPDLIIIDVMMPVMNGLEATKALKSDEATKGTPIIMLTALGKDSDIVSGLDAGADDYVEKPMNAKIFTARVRSHLRSKELYDELQAANKDLEATLDIVSSTNASLDITKIMKRVTAQLASHLELDRCSIVVIDENNKNAYVMASNDGEEDDFHRINLEKYPELVEAIKSKDLLHIEDTKTDPLMKKLGEVLHMPYKSILVVPISHGDSSVGTILLNAKKKDLKISGRDIHFSRLVAASCANTIKNAYLFDNLGIKNAALDEANRRLTELDKLKSNFIGMASHELKTPLNIVSGYLEMLIDGSIGSIDDKAKEILDITLESALGLAATVKEMLDISTIESGKLPLTLTSQNLGDSIKESVKQLRQRAESKSINIEYTGFDSDITATFDKPKINQVVVNLLANAIRFSSDNDKILLGIEQKIDEYVVYIKDSGKGIPENNMDKIFDEFFTTGTSGDGTGLGLPICKKLVEMHGGRIWAENNNAKGACFYFSLPANLKKKKHEPEDPK